jgi:hypothetical protein
MKSTMCVASNSLTVVCTKEMPHQHAYFVLIQWQLMFLFNKNPEIVFDKRLMLNPQINPNTYNRNQYINHHANEFYIL